jgi:hypothetical protein
LHDPSAIPPSGNGAMPRRMPHGLATCAAAVPVRGNAAHRAALARRAEKRLQRRRLSDGCPIA